MNPVFVNIILTLLANGPTVLADVESDIARLSAGTDVTPEELAQLQDALAAAKARVAADIADDESAAKQG